VLFRSTVLALAIRFGALKRRGMVLGLFMVGYGIARSIGELFREPDPQLESLAHGLTMGMALSAPMILIGIALVAYTWRRGPQRG